ncbi:MAG TPA: xanthine dehydrogenase family protein molybdopterin-binding subunit [Acidobacteriota bacterium]|nr:xanthine dehydrogenase family protein molybdopterin-binding subunit [Acidobacteriota bacterium]
MSEFQIIGKPVPMVDGASKVTGRGLYADDLKMAGMLYARVVRSVQPHARILKIDTSIAEQVPGVMAILIGEEVANKYGILPVGHDETALAVGKVRYIGEGVAAVAATTREGAEQAADAIEVTYEPLPAYFDARVSMDHPAALIQEDKPNNIEKQYHHYFGNLADGFAQAHLVRMDSFLCPQVTHAAMEPHSTVANYEGGKLTVWSSTQTPYYLHRTLSSVLELPMARIRVIKPLVGGGFGGKDEPLGHEICTAALAIKTGRPVKLTVTREEVFYIHRGRPTQIVELKTGVTRDGKITAVECRTIQDGGAFCSYGVVTILYSGALLGAIYDIANMKYDGYRVLTNKPASGAMRGHGTVNVRFAFESQLDMIAHELGIDPAEIRLRNALTPNTYTVNDLRVTSYGYPDCIRKATERAGWGEKKGKLPYGKGIGIAGSHYVSGAANSIIRANLPHSTVMLKLDIDGGVTIYTGTSEIGQGSDTIQVQIVAEELGLTLDRVRIVSADSDLTPMDLGSYSSRVTFMAGNACLQAARDMKARVAKAASELLNVPTDRLLYRGNKISDKNDASHSVSFEDAVVQAIGTQGGTIVTKGSYTPPKEAQGGNFKGAGVGPSPAYSYSAQVAEVTVNPDTGVVTVDRIVAAHDCGRALNPLTVEGQIEGSVSMGLGQAMTEQVLFDQGLIMNPSLLEYKTPGIFDSPKIEAIIVESAESEGPYGAKEAGEGSLAAVIPAVANAIYDAVGVRITELPFSPEKILAALKKKKQEAQKS